MVLQIVMPCLCSHVSLRLLSGLLWNRHEHLAKHTIYSTPLVGQRLFRIQNQLISASIRHIPGLSDHVSFGHPIPKQPQINIEYHHHIHSRKLTWPLKIGHPKRKLVFQPVIFRCYVSFREGTILLPASFFLLVFERR